MKSVTQYIDASISQCFFSTFFSGGPGCYSAPVSCLSSIKSFSRSSALQGHSIIMYYPSRSLQHIILKFHHFKFRDSFHFTLYKFVKWLPTKIFRILSKARSSRGASKSNHSGDADHRSVGSVAQFFVLWIDLCVKKEVLLELFKSLRQSCFKKALRLQSRNLQFRESKFQPGGSTGWFAGIILWASVFSTLWELGTKTFCAKSGGHRWTTERMCET